MTSNGLNHKTTQHHAPIIPTFAVPPPVVTQGAQPRCEIILVTPAMAEEWLKSNTMNRRIRKNHVRALARDIAEGRYMFNPQPVSFGTDGSLLDGQHRLTAIVKAGVPAPMAVWFNIALDTRRVMDTGKVRSLADVENLNNQRAALAVSMLRGAGGAVEATMAERVSFYRRFSTEIEFVLGQFTTLRRGITQSSVLAAICRGSLYIKRDDIERFCRVLATGMPTGEERDATVIRLRDRLLQPRRSGGSAATSESYSITANALRAYADGRALSRIFAASTDLFPIPKAASSE